MNDWQKYTWNGWRRDVAKKCNVAGPTVSHAMRKHSNVGEKTVLKVRETFFKMALARKRQELKELEEKHCA